MSNVLGTLFGDIAEAIRGKTGETGTMKPAEFPDKIAGISVGGSGSAGGSVDGSGWLVASGQIDSDTGRPVIIEHGLGVVPDIVQVAVGVWGPMSDASYSKMSIIAGFNLSKRLMSGAEGLEDYGFVFLYNPSTNGGMVGRSMAGLESLSESRYTAFCNVTSNTMQLGTNGAYLLPGKTYTWAAYVKQ